MAKEDRFVRPRAPNRSRVDFEGMIDKGKNPRAVNFQTANGTALWEGTGFNGDYYPRTEPTPELPPAPTRPPGRSNRTGE